MKLFTSLRGMSRAALLDLIEASLGYAGRMERRERAGVEITGVVADGPRSLILDQVSNGVPTRIAVLAALGESLT